MLSNGKKIIFGLIALIVCVGGLFIYEVNKEHHYGPKTAEILFTDEETIKSAFILKDDNLPQYDLSSYLTFVSDVEKGTANLETTKKVFGFYECEINRVYDEYLPNISYQSGDEAIATIDQNGVITGLAKGETVITVTGDAMTIEIPITVYKAVEITEFEQDILLLKGDTKKLVSTQDYDVILSEIISSNEKVATVDQNGVVTAQAKGKSEIYTYINEEKISTQVTVKQPVESVSLSPITIYVGDSATLKASYAPKDADHGTTFTYKVADSSVAGVKGNVLTAVKTGETMITATSANGISAQAKVTVKNYPKATPSIKTISRSEFEAYGGEKYSDNSPYAHCFVITFDQPVIGFSINYVNDDGFNKTTGSAIYNNASVPANTPLYFWICINQSDILATRGFSYVNRDGSKKYYALHPSGKDGTTLMIEYK